MMTYKVVHSIRVSLRSYYRRFILTDAVREAKDMQTPTVDAQQTSSLSNCSSEASAENLQVVASHSNVKQSPSGGLPQGKERSSKNLQPKTPTRVKSNSTASDALGSTSNVRPTPNAVRVVSTSGIREHQGCDKLARDGRTSSPRKLESSQLKTNKSGSDLNMNHVSNGSSSPKKKIYSGTKESPPNSSIASMDSRKGCTGSFHAKTFHKEKNVKSNTTASAQKPSKDREKMGSSTSIKSSTTLNSSRCGNKEHKDKEDPMKNRSNKKGGIEHGSSQLSRAASAEKKSDVKSSRSRSGCEDDRASKKMDSCSSVTSTLSKRSKRCNSSSSGDVSPVPNTREQNSCTSENAMNARLNKRENVSRTSSNTKQRTDIEHNRDGRVGKSDSKCVSTCQQSATSLVQRPVSGRPGSRRSVSSIARSNERSSSARSSRASLNQFEVLNSSTSLKFATPSYPELRPRSSRSTSSPKIHRMEVLNAGTEQQRVPSPELSSKRRHSASPKKCSSDVKVTKLS